MKRLPLLLSWFLALLLLVPAALLTWVATTEAGLQAVVARLQHLGPVTLRIDGIEGSLTGGVRAQRFELHHRRVHIVATDLAGEIDLLPLLWQTVSVRRLDMASLSIDVPRVPDTGKRWNERFLPAFLHIDVRRLTVRSGVLQVMDKARFDATDANLTAAVHSRRIRLYRGELDLGSLHLSADGELQAAARLPMQVNAEALWRPARLPEWRVRGELGGDLDGMPVKAVISAPFNARVDGLIDTPTRQWQFTGTGTVDDFNLRPFGGGDVLGLLSGQLQLSADRDGFAARGTAESSGLAAGRFDVGFRGAYTQRVLSIREATVVHRGSGARAEVLGHVRLRADQRPWVAVQGRWTDLRWPLRATYAPFHSAQGRFSLVGERPYAVTADAGFRVLDLPVFSGTARGVLRGTHIDLDSSELAALGGQARLRGQVRWTAPVAWSVEGKLDGIDPGLYRSHLPGRLDIEARASGNRLAGDTDLTLELQRIAGQLRETSARGSGTLRRRAGDWQFDALRLQLGGAQLSLDGSYGAQQRDLRFGLESGDLALLHPEARGRLVARGRLSGPALQPQLSLRAQGSRFAFGTQSLRSLDLDADIDLRPDGRLAARLQARDLRLAGRLLQVADLTLDGRAENHSALLSLSGPGLKADLATHASYADGRWQGQLRELALGDGGELGLSLAAPASWSLSATGQQLANTCLKDAGGARLCLQGQRKDDGWQAVVEASQLPLRTLTAGLTPDVDYEGTIGLQAHLQRSAASPAVVGQLQATLRDAQLRRRLPNGREERFALGTGDVSASLDSGSFGVKVALDAGSAGNVRGSLKGERRGADWRGHGVQGDLALESAGLLGLLDVYLAGVDRAAGRLALQAAVSGTLGAPDLSGNLQLRDGEIDQYPVNLALRDISLDARLEGSQLSLEGQLKAGDGRARFNGDLAWRQREPTGQLHIEGEDLRIVNVPEARILASPRLDFRVQGRRIDVRGDVRVPFAVLEPVTITNAVLSSGDEVRVGEPPKDAMAGWQVASDINLVLGERVSLDTFGLKGRLTGSLRTMTDASQVNRGSGELNVVPGGRYAAFGRNLDIARGRLIFNNGPLADPAIDLRAQKVYPDVTAGVNVRGSLRAPRMTFFSEPSIPQSQIVSLILAGGSLDSVQSSSRPGAARNEALAQGGAILAQQIGSRIGIEDVGIESDINNETSLVLGKYLSPRLYVSYGISLAEAINTLKLRYTIGDRWTLKTESGRERAADLVYTIQR